MRECRFEGGVWVGEKITEIVPEKKLVFVVTRQPEHPEITHHFELEKGRFFLRDNRNGTTTITGTSWYRLNVAPVWYFDIWTQAIISRVHQRVFRHIGKLAEK